MNSGKKVLRKYDKKIKEMIEMTEEDWKQIQEDKIRSDYEWDKSKTLEEMGN
jgi:hypothetical protein